MPSGGRAQCAEVDEAGGVGNAACPEGWLGFSKRSCVCWGIMGGAATPPYQNYGSAREIGRQMTPEKRGALRSRKQTQTYKSGRMRGHLLNDIL